jgi:hypothetical protein
MLSVQMRFVTALCDVHYNKLAFRCCLSCTTHTGCLTTGKHIYTSLVGLLRRHLVIHCSHVVLWGLVQRSRLSQSGALNKAVRRQRTHALENFAMKRKIEAHYQVYDIDSSCR